MSTLFAYTFGDWSIGSFTAIDLIAATTNAFAGALLCLRPSHYRKYTVVGIVAIAVVGGIGGGVSRDVLLNDIPSALTNPWYVILTVSAGLLALALHYKPEMKFRDGLFVYFTAFSLPWYAAIGVNKALETGIPLVGAVLIGVVGPTAGRFFIDLTSGVTPQQFTRGEWFVGTAVLTSLVYIGCDELGLSIWPATLISVAAGFTFRVLAIQLTWEEPLPRLPKEVSS